MLMLGLATTAMADDSTPATTGAATTVDTSCYTLLHPAPSDQLRGMSTDRPNKTNTPDTVDAGHLQIESGLSDVTFFRRGSARNNLYSAGEEDFRLGLLNQLEVNAAISLYNSIPARDEQSRAITRHNGIGDLYLGGALNLWGNDAGDTVWATSLGILPQFKIPTAAHDVGNGHFEAFVGVPFLINLPGGFHLGAETIASDQRNTADDGNVTDWQNMFSVDRVFLERFDFYAEYWSRVTTEQHQKVQQSIDIGVTYTVNNSLILDTGFNFGLNSATVDFEWLTGFSVRI